MKILTISKPYVNAAYREKLRIWGKIEGIQSFLICPQTWDSILWEESPQDITCLSTIKLPIVFNGKNHFFFFRGLRNAIRKINPDFINLEEEHYSFVSYQTMRIANRYHIPFSFYTWQNIYKKYPFPFSYFERLIFNSCSFGLAGNLEAKEVLRKKFFAKDIEIIPQMGIDPQIFFPTKNFARMNSFVPKLWEASGKRILFAGRMTEEKGIQNLIEAFKILLAKNRDIKLILCGDGPDKERFRRALYPLPQERWCMLDPLSSYQLADLYRSVDILVLPSITKSNWKEQFGRVLIEAMASKVVCIGSTSGEIPNLIRDKELCFQEGYSQDLADKISNVLDWNTERRCELLNRMYKYVHQEFTQEAIAIKQLNIIQKHLNT